MSEDMPPSPYSCSIISDALSAIVNLPLTVSRAPGFRVRDAPVSTVRFLTTIMSPGLIWGFIKLVPGCLILALVDEVGTSFPDQFSSCLQTELRTSVFH